SERAAFLKTTDFISYLARTRSGGIRFFRLRQGFLLKYSLDLLNLVEYLMPVERTLSIVKPDAVKKNVIGEIYSRFESNGLKVIAARMLHLSQAEAEGFYAVHRSRPFFNDLVKFM